MLSKQKIDLSIDPEKHEKGIAENEESHHIGQEPEWEDDEIEPDDHDVRETFDPNKVDREGGDLAGTASGPLLEEDDD